MVASRSLGKLRGVPEEDLIEIDEIHIAVEQIMKIMLNANLCSYDMTLAILEDFDYQLQDLWKFSRDKEMHTLCKLFLFRKDWHGRQFQCCSSGEVVVIDATKLREAECVPVGEGFVDVGRYGAYFRTVGCGEVGAKQ